MRKIQGLNTDKDDCATTLMTHYMKEGLRNFLTPLRGGQNEEILFIDAYNGTWEHRWSGTILTGIDYRCMHFILEYERNTTAEPDA